MKIFLDANIIVSVLNKEYPVFTYASQVLSLSDSKHHKVYTSPICLAIAFYFSEKKSGTKQAKAKMELLVSKLNIAIIDEKGVQLAATNKCVLDFEDGLEYYAAKKAGCDYIITEDTEDFHFSDIPAVNAQHFLELYFINGKGGSV